MKTKADYKEAFELVTTVINEWDPYGLIEQGFPRNEFDAEIGDILPRLKEVKDSTDCTRIVSEVFGKWFSKDDFTQEMCADVGLKLYQALSSHKLTESKQP